MDTVPCNRSGSVRRDARRGLSQGPQVMDGQGEADYIVFEACKFAVVQASFIDEKCRCCAEPHLDPYAGSSPSRPYSQGRPIRTPAGTEQLHVSVLPEGALGAPSSRTGTAHRRLSCHRGRFGAAGRSIAVNILSVHTDAFQGPAGTARLAKEK